MAYSMGHAKAFWWGAHEAEKKAKMWVVCWADLMGAMRVDLKDRSMDVLKVALMADLMGA